MEKFDARIDELRAALIAAKPALGKNGHLDDPDDVLAQAVTFIRSKTRKKIKSPRPPFDYTTLPLEQIGREYAAGASWASLKRKYGGNCPKTLARHVVQACPDIETRSGDEQRGQSYAELPLEQIADEYQAGASWTSLAKKYGVSCRKTLQTYVLEARPDLELRTKKEQEQITWGQKKDATAMEKLTKEDLMNWHNPYVGHD